MVLFLLDTLFSMAIIYRWLLQDRTGCRLFAMMHTTDKIIAIERVSNL